MVAFDLRDYLGAAVTVLAIVLAFTTFRGYVNSREARAVAEERAAEVNRLDSISRARADSSEARLGRLAASEERLDSLQTLQEEIRRAATARAEASRDSIAHLRAHIDTMAVVDSATVRELVVEYETIIEQQDTTIASLARELYAEREGATLLREALGAVQMEVDALKDAVAGRDAQIAALEDALDSPSLFDFIPDNLVGDVLKVGGGAFIGYALAR